MQNHKKGASFVEGAYMLLAFAVLVITASVTGLVLAGIQSGQTANSVASNATGSGLTAVANFATLLPPMGTILAAVIIISLLLGAFVLGRRD